MTKKYLIDGNNEHFSLNVGYRADINLLLNNFPIANVAGHTFKFDIGQEGEEAIYSGTATITDDSAPDIEISLSIPEAAFSSTYQQLVLQIRWTDLEPVERIIYKGFLDVLDPVTPKP